MDVCLFWHGSHLRPVDRVCTASMLAAGHDVVLFSYEPVANVPAGVKSASAGEIVSEELFRRLVFADGSRHWPFGLAQFSDLFRVALMKHGRGVWLDTDIYLVKPFRPDPQKPYLAWENKTRLGVSAMYLPRDNPVISEFDRYIAEFLEGRAVLPNWLGFRRRVLRPLYYRAIGKTLMPANAGATILGNDGISRLARRHGFMKDAAPKESFYYWNGAEAARIFDPSYGLEPMSHPDFIGFHIHVKEPSNAPAAPGSFYHWMIEQVRDRL